MSIIRATATQIASLATFSTCEISDALIKLGIGNGGFIPDLEMLSKNSSITGTTIGEAFTVKMVDGNDSESSKLKGHFVDLAPPGSIVVISSPPHVKSASFGGLLGTAASVKGVEGIVIDGRCRDLSELRALKLPVFARGHSTLGQSPFTRPSTVQEPIFINPIYNFILDSTATLFLGMTVYPFDLILGDEDGVVVVRPVTVDSVLKLAKIGREIDERCRLDLLKGRGLAETFGEYRAKK